MGSHEKLWTGANVQRVQHSLPLANLPFANRLPSRVRERQRVNLTGALIAVDSAVVLGAFVGTDLLRHGSVFGASNAPPLTAILLILYLVVAYVRRAYASPVLEQTRIGITRSWGALLIAAAALLMLAFFLKTSDAFSRLNFGTGTAGAMVGLPIGRLLFARALRLFDIDVRTTQVIVVDGIDVPHLDGIERVDAVHYCLSPDSNDPIALDRLGAFLSQVDRVIVACPRERRRAWAMALKGANIAGEIIDEEVRDLGAVGARHYGDFGTVIVAEVALDLPRRIAKRALDLSVVVPALVLLAPIILAVGIAIRLEDGGPVLFRQKRVGRGNRLFTMLKFRSMSVQNCDAAGHRSTMRDDDRITRIGAFIRRTSLDELPQLLNVLQGEMSLVGPRPHALGSLAGDKLFWEVDERYWHRHRIKPGLTGLAQVRGYRGATNTRDDLVYRLQSDLEYVVGWSILRDIRILLATFSVIVHRNAY